MGSLNEVMQKVYPNKGETCYLDKKALKRYQKDMEQLLKQKDPNFLNDYKKNSKDFNTLNKERMDSINNQLKDNELFLKISNSLSNNFENGNKTNFINSKVDKAVIINGAKGDVNINLVNEKQIKERFEQIISLSVKKGKKEASFKYSGKFEDLDEDEKELTFRVLKKILPNLTKEQLEYLAGSMIVKIKDLSYADLKKIQNKLKDILKIGDRELLDFEVVEKSEVQNSEGQDLLSIKFQLPKVQKSLGNKNKGKGKNSGFINLGTKSVFPLVNPGKSYRIAASSGGPPKKRGVVAKYAGVLDLGQKLGIKDGALQEEAGILKIKGVAATPFEKSVLWDKIKEIGGDSPTDIKANIAVEDNSVYHRHTVRKGDSLSKIAKHYYGDAMKYNKIFEANTRVLKNPDLIHPNQILVIPNL